MSSLERSATTYQSFTCKLQRNLCNFRMQVDGAGLPFERGVLGTLVNKLQKINMTAMSESGVVDQIDIKAADIDTALASFSASARVFSSDHPRLIDEYENKWIGVYDGKIEAVADTLEDVVRQIELKSIPITQTIVRRIDRDEKTLVL